MLPRLRIHRPFLDVKSVAAHGSMVHSPCLQIAYHMASAKWTTINKCLRSNAPFPDAKLLSARTAVIYLACTHRACHWLLTKWAYVLSRAPKLPQPSARLHETQPSVSTVFKRAVCQASKATTKLSEPSHPLWHPPEPQHTVFICFYAVPDRPCPQTFNASTKDHTGPQPLWQPRTHIILFLWSSDVATLQHPPQGTITAPSPLQQLADPQPFVFAADPVPLRIFVTVFALPQLTMLVPSWLIPPPYIYIYIYIY